MMHALHLTLTVATTLILVACPAPRVPTDPLPPPDGQRACTLIGCESQLRFELEAGLRAGERYELEACIDGDCTSATLTLDPAGFGAAGAFVVDATSGTITVRLGGGDYSGPHQVSLSLIGPERAITRIAEEGVEFERTQPNGPGCEPVCWQAVVRG